MQFAAFPMRCLGRPLPQAELANLAPCIGDLRIEEIRDEQLMRYIRMARVLVLDRPRATDVLAVLYEPQIIAMSPRRSRCRAMSAWAISVMRRVG
jgi:hypothetical protein